MPLYFVKQSEGKNGEETYIQERKAAKKKRTSKDGKQIVEVREPALELADQAAEGASQQATEGTEGTSDSKKKAGSFERCFISSQGSGEEGTGQEIQSPVQSIWRTCRRH